ncbi:hypothetical protein B0H14DRAFT_3474456 [Mycena olivaceomarginata]|nr:hypothetical protein B0H14DRAFT_3474456 [Mycena olivaceomarginata]
MSEVSAKRNRSLSKDSTSDNLPKKKKKQSNEQSPDPGARTQTIINQIYGGIGGKGGPAINNATGGTGGVGNAPIVEYHVVAKNVIMTKMDMEPEKGSFSFIQL